MEQKLNNSGKARNLVFTLNNYDKIENYEEGLNKLAEDAKYLVYGFEIGESGTPHIQGYIEFKSPRSYKNINNMYFSNKAYMATRKGSSQQASDYCKKEGNFKEFGEISKQGERADLNELKNKILNGETNIDDIVENNTEAYHQYGRTLEKVEEVRNKRIYRTEMTKGIWYYGESGVGKTKKAFEGYDPETHYNLNTDDNGWWDGYCGQETVIINEFRGELTYRELLKLVDWNPETVKRRNRAPFPFTSKLVIITSSLRPDKIYKNRMREDKIEQLYRRFEIIKICPDGTEQKWSGNNAADH